MNSQVKIRHVFFEDGPSDTRLKNPHRFLIPVDRWSPLPLTAVFFRLLKLPVLRFLVLLPDAVVKVARKPANNRLVSRIGPAKPSTRQSAENLVWTHNDDRLPHLRCLHRRNHRSAGSAVDDDIVFRLILGSACWNRKQKCKYRCKSWIDLHIHAKNPRNRS